MTRAQVIHAHLLVPGGPDDGVGHIAPSSTLHGQDRISYTAHVYHKLRGSGSNRDERLCERRFQLNRSEAGPCRMNRGWKPGDAAECEGEA
jgi:hypothetical protein